MSTNAPGIELRELARVAPFWRGARASSWVSALRAASLYAAAALVYLLLASLLGASWASDVEQLAHFALSAGAVFAALTTATLLVVLVRASLRAERDGLELERRQRALLTADRRAYAGLIASSVAHDANNLLTVLDAELQFLRDESAAESRARVERLQTCSQRLAALNRRLDNATLRCGPQHVVEAVETCAATLRAHAMLRGCRLSIDGDRSLSVTAEPARLCQILDNLLLNAGEATHGRGTVEVRVLRRQRELHVEVHDNGPGVAPARRAGLFDALESTRHGGHGLGLFSARACTTSLGGSIEVDESPLGGALFRVRLPLS
jgi:signal transduction histidine kinase